MHWQTWGFSLGALVFIFALIPMVRQREKPPLTASIPTAVVLFIFVGLFASLGGLDTAAITDMITGGLWATLAVQRVITDRRDKAKKALGLAAWDIAVEYDHKTLPENFRVIDQHDMQTGRGVPLPPEAATTTLHGYGV